MDLAGTATQLDIFADPSEIEGKVLWRVQINGTLDPLAGYATLAHELGHIYCGHLGGRRRGLWLDRSGHLTPPQQELEAEAVAHIVCARAGLETRSAEYLAQHAGDHDLTAISVAAIVAVSRVEARRPIS